MVKFISLQSDDSQHDLTLESSYSQFGSTNWHGNALVMFGQGQNSSDFNEGSNNLALFGHMYFLGTVKKLSEKAPEASEEHKK